MRFGKACLALGAAGLASVLGCSSAPGHDYFTFLLEGVPVQGSPQDIYVYLVWRYEPDQSLPPSCVLVEFDFLGRAERDAGGQRTRDGADQSANTYVHYDWPVDAQSGGLCARQLDARFEYGGVAYNVHGTVTLDFREPRTLTLGTSDPSFISSGFWTIEGMPGVSGTASFWPAEWGTNGIITRVVHPTAP